jgi:transposase-like protein
MGVKGAFFLRILTHIKQKKLAEFRIIFMDSTTIKLHRHGSGAPKKGLQSIGKNVAGKGTKIHAIMGSKDAICIDITGFQVRRRNDAQSKS